MKRKKKLIEDELSKFFFKSNLKKKLYRHSIIYQFPCILLKITIYIKVQFNF
jgi:hypothetical protein